MSEEQERLNLHAAIMNIPCCPYRTDDAAFVLGYKFGHRDARHAAAELALTSAPGAGEAGAEPVAWVSRGVVSRLKEKLGKNGYLSTPMRGTPDEGDEPLYTHPAPHAVGSALTDEQIRGAIARGWCYRLNANKEMDVDLVNAIACEVRDALAAAPTPTQSEAVKGVSATGEPADLQRAMKWGRLYDRASVLMATIGYLGEVSTRSDEVSLLMDALSDLDNGQHMPGLMPLAAPSHPPATPSQDLTPGGSGEADPLERLYDMGVEDGYNHEAMYADQRKAAALNMARKALAAPSVPAVAVQAEPPFITAMIDARRKRYALDQTCTPAFLHWLDTMTPREGVGANEAWNAGVAWAISAHPKPASQSEGEREESVFHHRAYGDVTEAQLLRATQPSPASPIEAGQEVSEREVMQAIRSANCFGLVRMTYESGPYDIDKPGNQAMAFARAILALRSGASAQPAAAGRGWSPKEAWWAGYREGKGLPANMPRQEALNADSQAAAVPEAVEKVPACWLSSKQLKRLSGEPYITNYVPYSLAPEGNFDTPVYLTAPAQPAEGGATS